MKYLTADGRYWIKVKDDVASVGLTSETLDHFGSLLVVARTAGQGVYASRGMSLAAVEGVFSLGCIASPLWGTLDTISDDAEENPMAITPETPLFTFTKYTLPDNLQLIRENDALSFV